MDMDEEKIVQAVLQQLKKSMKIEMDVPVGVSARHCHLSRGDLNILFGKDYSLTPKFELYQPGQFAAEETVTIVGPKGAIHNVRILGPLRNRSQVEISISDSYKLGFQPPVRLSGDLVGSSPVTLVGPKGSIYLKEGLIIAQAHIHMSPLDAERFSLQHGDTVSVLFENKSRKIQFNEVVVRVSPNYRLEMHIDTDEANAGQIVTGQMGRIVLE